MFEKISEVLNCGHKQSKNLDIFKTNNISNSINKLSLKIKPINKEKV